jgi:hypothetical protein
MLRLDDTDSVMSFILIVSFISNGLALNGPLFLFLRSNYQCILNKLWIGKATNLLRLNGSMSGKFLNSACKAIEFDTHVINWK